MLMMRPGGVRTWNERGENELGINGNLFLSFFFKKIIEGWTYTKNLRLAFFFFSYFILFLNIRGGGLRTWAVAKETVIVRNNTNNTCIRVGEYMLLI